ncbi:hypothetical protein AB0G15_06420 [Streptosporangium sp. NPDC023825]|uniref:hypothetical protein n=1 Tax=Streptosporangium sp. NPDC023825 TaxID=3154909 RepID=UPI003426414F
MDLDVIRRGIDALREYDTDLDLFGYRSHLVVNGSAAGQVWGDWTCVGEALAPQAESFGAWYHTWADIKGCRDIRWFVHIPTCHCMTMSEKVNAREVVRAAP